MLEPLQIVLLVSGILSAALLFAALRLILRARILRGATWLGASIVTICVTLLAGALLVGSRGYVALTREDLVAVVTTKPIAKQEFHARFQFPDGTQSEFDLSGDELYVDARIVKWTSFANLLGLHTAYELDRVGGRYRALVEEQDLPRTIHSLARERRVDVFEMRQRFPQLAPLLDAEYGSATFAAADTPASYELRVSTTGLLLRQVGGRETR